MPTGPVQNGHAIAASVLGGIEILFGLIITIVSFVLSAKANMDVSLTPYWAGIAFIIPGIFGVIILCTKNRCVMITFMVLNIIVFVVEGLGCILLAVVVAIYASYASDIKECKYISSSKTCYCHYNGETKAINNIESCELLSDISTLLYVITVFLVLAALVTLAASILGCIAVCCNNNAQPGTVIIQQPPTTYNQSYAPDYKQ